jgi:hypothetical protein
VHWCKSLSDWKINVCDDDASSTQISKGKMNIDFYHGGSEELSFLRFGTQIHSAVRDRTRIDIGRRLMNTKTEIDLGKTSKTLMQQKRKRKQNISKIKMIKMTTSRT